MLAAARSLRRLANSAVCLARCAASGTPILPGGGAARFHDYDAAVTACVERRALWEGRQVHARIVASGYRPALYLATRLLVMYVRCGALEDARNVLDGMPERNVVSWTAMISGYSQNGRPEKALELFIKMLRDGKSLETFSLLLWILRLQEYTMSLYLEDFNLVQLVERSCMNMMNKSTKLYLSPTALFIYF
jgi:pentatricopeptide repeat protein